MQSTHSPETTHRENLAGRPRKRNSIRPTTVIEPERILELGNGLELWKVHASTLREQDVNARSMPKAMFERLSQTIARDKRLESLPLCAKTESDFEIISGHHRTRAATAAGLSELFVLVDVTGLSRSQIAAKQLATTPSKARTTSNCWPRFIARSKTPSQNLKPSWTRSSMLNCQGEGRRAGCGDRRQDRSPDLPAASHGAQRVDAGVSPEIDQHDLSAQGFAGSREPS